MSKIATNILDEVNPKGQKSMDSLNEKIQLVANSIAQISFTKSKLSDYISPFAANARKYGFEYEGGKEDDISVVVAKIL